MSNNSHCDAIGFALVVDVSHIGHEPCENGVYTFPDIDTAIRFAVDQLIKIGFVRVVADRWVHRNNTEVYATLDDVLHAYQSTLHAFDLFHLHEHRSVSSLAKAG